jgi:hypothetical protein
MEWGGGGGGDLWGIGSNNILITAASGQKVNIKGLNSQDDGSVIASRRNGNHYAKECSVINLRRGGSQPGYYSDIASRTNGNHYAKECSAILLRRGGNQDIIQILSAGGMAIIW